MHRYRMQVCSGRRITSGIPNMTLSIITAGLYSVLTWDSEKVLNEFLTIKENYTI